ncbi:hypothetical protein [Microbulbifer hainanensis]|uniref:hypothetical protein n=1 Tax=Microbulbifer hainanensis TaxID=2735675 RepID=UPI0018692883|nr:hypothetical protein [Microbulbifer hainanensis]
MRRHIILASFLALTPSLSEAGQWYSEIAYTSFNYERGSWYDEFDKSTAIINAERKTDNGSFSFSAGYQFNDIFGLNLGYTEFNQHVSHGVIPGIHEILNGTAGDYSTEKIDGSHLEGTLSRRVGSFSPYLKIGILFPDEIAPIAGAGIRWDISNTVGLNLFWEKYFDAAERWGDSGSWDDEKTDVESYNLGLRYTFN